MSESKIKFSQQIREFDEDQLDEIMDNITLRRPKSAYTIYCKEKFEEYKKEATNPNFILFSRECSPKWAQLPDEEKDIYIKKYEEERNKYLYEVEIVRHYLFKDYNDVVQCSITPYKLFLNERMIEGFEKNLDPKDVKISASKDWKSMPIKEKKIYKNRKEENDNFFEKVKKLKKVSGISLFIQKVIEMAKKKDEPIPKLEEIKDGWKELPLSMKTKFKKYAQSINEEREKLNDIFELINGIKPRLPSGPYSIFIKEKLKENEINDLNEGKKLWKQLNEDEKEIYLKKAHRLKLAYQYKKMIYNKKIRRFLPKKPSTLNNQKDKYDEKMEKYKNCVFDLPQPPLNEYNLYQKEKNSELKKENNLTSNEIQKIIAKEWKEDEDLQLKYQKMAEENRKRFKKQMEEFNKLGYYTKKHNKYFSDDEESEENDDENLKKEKVKKRTNRNKSISSNKKKKSPLSKDKRRQSKNAKKIGKSQRKNKK